MSSAAPAPADVEGLIEEARAAERAGRLGTARRRYEAALHRLRADAHEVTASAVMRWIGRLHELEGDLDAASDCYGAAHASAVACASSRDSGRTSSQKSMARSVSR